MGRRGRSRERSDWEETSQEGKITSLMMACWEENGKNLKYIKGMFFSTGVKAKLHGVGGRQNTVLLWDEERGVSFEKPL